MTTYTQSQINELVRINNELRKMFERQSYLQKQIIDSMEQENKKMKQKLEQYQQENLSLKNKISELEAKLRNSIQGN